MNQRSRSLLKGTSSMDYIDVHITDVHDQVAAVKVHVLVALAF